MGKVTMDALVYEGARELNMRRVPVPEPLADEVLIRVERVGICGSELSGYLGQNSLRKPPLIMGHEFTGTIAATGSAAGEWKSGERVTVNPLIACGQCRQCRTGHPQLCKERKIIGAARPGAFAEFVAVPASQVLRMPDSLSMESGALIEPLACAVHAARLAQFDPTDRLLIFGAGPIGLLVLQTAQAYGLSDIVIMDLSRERLRIAEALGAKVADSATEVEELAPLDGFDVVVDAVGVAATRGQSVMLTRHGGRVVFSGLHEAESPIPVNVVIRNELKLLGGFCYDQEDFATALNWLSAGKVKLDPWIQHSPLDKGKECFEQLLGNPGEVAKILLTV